MSLKTFQCYFLTQSQANKVFILSTSCLAIPRTTRYFHILLFRAIRARFDLHNLHFNSKFLINSQFITKNKTNTLYDYLLQIQIVRSYNLGIGMKFGIKKCFMQIMKQRKKINNGRNTTAKFGKHYDSCRRRRLQEQGNIESKNNFTKWRRNKNN